MVCRRAPAVSVLMVFLLTAFAGCVAEEDPAPKAPGEAVDPGASAVHSVDAKRKAATELTAAEAVFAPVWREGRHWTYEVSGRLVGEPYTVTVGVVGVGDDQYVLGMDEGREFEASLLGTGGLFVTGVQKDSIALLQAAGWQDYIGFRRDPGESWQAGFFEVSFKMTKVGVVEVTHGAGTGIGIRTEGAVADRTLVVEYADAAAGYSLIEYKRGDDVLLAYRLQGVGESRVPGLYRWDVTATTLASSSGGFTPVSLKNVNSDGGSNLLFIRGEVENGRAAYGTVLDPENNQVIEIRADPERGGRTTATVPDKAGTWRALATSSGAKCSIWIHQVTIVTY